jgi:catechol 2,3-dioxygenase-like lactoylglutathione lyase family enzyme
MTATDSIDLPPVPDMRLELVPVPVADIDRALKFYVEQVGFHLDHDVHPTPDQRVTQLTPPGSACSILFSAGLGDISEMMPGAVKGLHLVVKDVGAARAALAARGVALSEIVEYPRGIKFAFFSDPDGNTWELQEIPPGI